MKRMVPLVCLLLVAISLLQGCAGKAKPAKNTQPTTKSTAPVGTTGELKNYTLVVPLEDGRTWTAKITNGHFETKSKKQILTLTGIEIRLTLAKSPIYSTSADTATVVITGSTVESTLSGHVKAFDGTQARQISAKSLRWKSTEDTIHVENFRWQGGGLTLSADNGAFTAALTDADFNGHVRMEIMDDQLDRRN